MASVVTETPLSTINVDVRKTWNVVINMHWVTRITLGVAGILAVAVSIADLFNLLTTFTWLNDRIPILTLLLVALVLSVTASENRDYSSKVNDKLERSTALIIETLNRSHGVEPVQFEGVRELYDYVAGKLNTATTSVDDITWGSRIGYRTQLEEQSYRNYLNAIDGACKRGNVIYREVSSFSSEHYLHRSEYLIKKGYYSYHLGYYDISAVKVPLMSYIIIDSSDVILGFYRVPLLPSEGEIYISVTQPFIVKFFKDYFETLWAGSTKIKEANIINSSVLNNVKNRLNRGDTL